jgi:hypothetical protein
MSLEKVFIIDWDKVYDTVKKGLELGEVVFKNGVAYKIQKEGHSVIIQHLPFVEQLIDPNENMDIILKGLSGIKSTVAVSAMVSTGVIVAAIAIQTIYLGKKLNKIQETVDLVSKDIHSQNVLTFMQRISDYMGTVESVRELLIDESIANQVPDIAHLHLADLAKQRNSLISLLDNLITYIPNASERHQEIMLDFTNTIIEILPATIRMEAELYDRLGKFYMSNHILREAGVKYNRLLSFYRDWCNERAKNIIRGDDKVAFLIENKKSDLQRLFNLEYNKALLSTQAVPLLT